MHTKKKRKKKRCQKKNLLYMHECRALIRYYDREERKLLQPDRNEFRELACLNSTESCSMLLHHYN